MNLWPARLRLPPIRLLPFRYFSTAKRNYYDVLGVSKTATPQEIKEAFYSLSKKYHPDVLGSDPKRFIEIKEAYDILKDDEKRRSYDAGFDSSNFDPFKQQWPYSEYPKTAFRGRRTYEYRTNHHHYSQEEIDRIWKQFQEQVRNRVNIDYDAEIRRRAQEKYYDEYMRKRNANGWNEYANRFNQQNNPDQNSKYRRGWMLFNKIMLAYIGIFFFVALFRALIGSSNSPQQKVVITEPKDSGYNYAQSKENLRKIMETPPTQQEDPNFPYGFPSHDRKD